MNVILHRSFEKNYRKLRESEKQRFKQRRNVFLKNPFDPILNNHALKGKYEGFRSINIGGDLRVVYKTLDEQTAIFVDIDTHSNLYR